MSASLVGELALWVALLLATWGTILSAIAGPLARADLARSGARAAHATTLFVVLAALALWRAFLRLEFGIAFVAARGGIAATPLERVIALWSAPAGALLVVAAAVGAVGSAALAIALRAWEPAARARGATQLAPGAAVIQLLLIAVLLTALVAEAPFGRTAWPAADGQGLPPSWRHIAMLVMFPIWSLALGAAAASAALATIATLGRSPGTIAVWSAATDWVRAAWLLATATLLLALWWSYRTMPSMHGWLARAVGPTAVAAWVALGLASSRSALRRIGSGRAGTLALMIPLPLLMAASLAAPEGTWDPLHQLAHGFGGAWWIVAISAVALVIVFVLVRGRRVMHAAPAERWEADRSTTAALGRRLTIVGAALSLTALTASTFARTMSLALVPGEPGVAADVGGREWRIVYQGLSVREDRTAFGAPRAHIVLHPFAIGRGGADAIIVSRVREQVDALGRPTAPPWSFPGIRHGVLQDVVVLPDSIGDGETAHVRVAFVPLISLLWLGGITLLAGGALVGHTARKRPT